MDNLIKIVAIIAVGMSFSLRAEAQAERKFIRDSYKMYNDSDYAGAQEASVKAMAEAPNSFEAAFNYADALFKQDKVDEAREQYEKLAAGETDKSKLSKLYHNIGNCDYVKGAYEKSIDNYKKSLRADPSNDATRYNLVAAQKMVDKKKDQKNNQQPQQQQQQQQEQQQQKDQQQQQQQQQNQQQQQQMDKEEAERLLQIAQQDEKDLQDKRKQPADAQRRRIEKNW